MSESHPDIDEARRLDHAQDLPAAVACLEALVAEAPERLDAWAYLSRLRLEVSDYEGARAAAQSGLAVGESAQLLAARAQVALACFDAGSALRDAQAAVELDIGDGHAWFALVSAFGLAGDELRADDAVVDGLEVCGAFPELLVEEATRPIYPPRQQITRLTELVTQYPHNRNVRLSLAIAHAVVGDLKAAAQVRGEVLAMNPRSHSVLAIDGMYLTMDGHWDLAQDRVNQAFALREGSFYGLYTQFRIHMQRSELGAARECLDHAHELTVGTTMHANFVTQMIEILDGPEVSSKVLASYLSQWQGHVGIRGQLAESLKLAGNTEMGLQVIREARSMDPRRYDLLEIEVRALMNIHNFEDAEPLVKQLEDGAERDLALTRIAASRAANVSEAEALYRGHLERYPGLDFAWGLLFRGAVERGDMDEVTRLTSHPFDVPEMVICAAQSYVHSLHEDFDAAEAALTALLKAPQADIPWVWGWEFAIEACLHPRLAHLSDTVDAAALQDGYQPE